MKKVSNKALADIFRKAKEHVWLNPENSSGRCHQFICWAIEEADNPLHGPYPRLTDVAIQAQKIINDRLRNAYCLEDWLERYSGVDLPDDFGRIDVCIRKIQITRHAWLDSLVAEFEAKKD